MLTETRIRSIFVAAVALAGCRANPQFCADHPGNNCDNPIDSGTDGPKRCTASADCAGATAICDLTGSMTCVQCTVDQHDACTGLMPACVGTTCQACTAHAQCAASNVCLPDGSCADQAQVAYVDPAGTDNTSCTKAAPCTRVSKALGTNRAHLKLKGTTDEAVVINNQNVTLHADPGAKLTRTSNGLLLEVKGTSHVAIYDLEISGASGSAGIGISIPAGSTGSLALTRANVTSNQGGGIVSAGGSLTVTQSTISGNQGGGISVSGVGVMFDITNTFIVRNGDNSASTFGGVSLGIAVAGANRFAFNTVADNEAAINSGGVICNVATFTGPNNIIARNALAGTTAGANAQTSGACSYPTSRIQADVNDLAFEHPDVPAPFVYKLTAGSSAVDQATTAVAVDVDNEGDLRPQGAQKDIGADELKR